MSSNFGDFTRTSKGIVDNVTKAFTSAEPEPVAKKTLSNAKIADKTSNPEPLLRRRAAAAPPIARTSKETHSRQPKNREEALDEALLAYLRTKQLAEAKAVWQERQNPHCRTVWGATPLHLLCDSTIYDEKKHDQERSELFASDSTEFLSVLLLAGADPEECNARGETPLDVAKRFEDYDKVALLTAHLAQSRGGHHPVMLAPPLMYVPKSKDEANAWLFTACRERSVDLLESALRCGADPNLKDEVGMTPLHHAAFLCQHHFIKPLVDRGARINVIDDVGRTALHIAVEQNDEAMVFKLLKLGAYPFAMNRCGEEPMDLAVSCREENRRKAADADSSREKRRYELEVIKYDSLIETLKDESNYRYQNYAAPQE